MVPPAQLAHHRRGFWLVAAAFTALMAFTTVPTPLYPLYQERDHFPTFMITVIFAAYGFGVMAGLYFAGHVSDYLGRRRVTIATVLIEVISAVMFLLLKDTASLLVARLLCGVGIGALTATATAHLSELDAVARPGGSRRFASTVATVVNTGGLSLGPLIAGLLVEWLPAPLTLSYAVFLVLLVLSGAAIAAAPETVASRPPASRPRYRPQQVQVPGDARPAFFAAAVAAAAAFSVLGFFTSLTASFVGGVLHHGSRLLAGSIVFGVIGASAASQLVFARTGARRKLQIGMTLMALGLLLVAGGALIESLALFIVAGVLAGAGVGLVFQSSIAAAGRMASPEHRGETLAGMFLAAYTGITVPVIAVGVALGWFAPPDVIVAFAGLVLLAVLAATGQLLRHTGS
jgi:MFS family permease